MSEIAGSLAALDRGWRPAPPPAPSPQPAAPPPPAAPQLPPEVLSRIAELNGQNAALGGPAKTGHQYIDPRTFAAPSPPPQQQPAAPPTPPPPPTPEPRNLGEALVMHMRQARDAREAAGPARLDMSRPFGIGGRLPTS